MPDCESRTQRKNSIDMASESTRFPNLCCEAHGAARSRTGKREAFRKSTSQVQKGLDQVGERIHRDSCGRHPALRSGRRWPRRSRACSCGRSRARPRESLWRRARRRLPRCGRWSVIHHDHFIDEFRHGAEHLLDALFLVQAGDDDGDGLAFIHGGTTFSGRRASYQEKRHWYHDNDEAGLCSLVILCGLAGWLGRRSDGRTYGVRAAMSMGSTSIWPTG